METKTECEPEIKRRKRKSSPSHDGTKPNPESDNDSSSIIPLIPSNFRVPSLQQIHSSNEPASLVDSDGSTPPVANSSSLEEANPVTPLILTITCGYFSAKLHMDKFYCPGIHQLCIEYEGQFISPKQFTIIAGKDKQKDWKAAMKLNQQPMRVLFEKHKIDFYKHLDFCSGRCVSKVIKPMGGVASDSDNSTGLDPSTIIRIQNADSEDTNDYKIPAYTFNQQSTSSDILQSENGDSTIFSDPDTFWTAVYQLGIFYELTQEIDEQFNVLRTCFKIPEMRSKAAHKLSELVRVMDLKEKIQTKLMSKRSLTKAQSAVVENELSELKKIAQNQEKKQREIKRKSEILDQLIGQSMANHHRHQRCVDLSISNPLPSP